jgi:superfamily II DNA or RNA helicase
METTRDIESQKAIDVWMKTSNGTLELTTGVGKTKIGLDIAAALAWALLGHKQVPRIIIITPTENLRDTHWADEAKKWGMDFMFTLGHVTTMCIQSAYKLTGLEYDLAIVDEIHTTLSEEYSKFYTNNKLHRILGLSATIPADKRPLLDTIAPVVYTITPTEASEKSLISKYKVYNVSLELTNTELATYKSHDTVISQAERELMTSLNIPLARVFNSAISCLKDFTKPSSVRMWASRYMNSVRGRKTVVNNAYNKLDATCKILSLLNTEKALIFAESIKFAELICKTCHKIGCSIYHSKMKDDLRKQVLEDFNNKPEIKVLSTVKALDLGLNVENVSLCIIAAGSGNPLQFTQRLGRGVRKTTEDKVAICINLYCKDTQEVKWVQKRTQNEPNSIWITLEEFLKLYENENR